MDENSSASCADGKASIVQRTGKTRRSIHNIRFPPAARQTGPPLEPADGRGSLWPRDFERHEGSQNILQSTTLMGCRRLVVGYHGMSGYGLAGSGNAGERGESEATMNTSKNAPSMSTRTLSAIVGMFASRRMLGCLRATFPRPVGGRRLSCVSFRKSRADLTLVSPVESGDFVWRWM